MTSKSPVRSCEDVDESVLSYAEIKALAAGNPKIKEKMELDVQVAKLRVAKTNHKNTQFMLQDRLRKELPASIEAIERRLARLREDRKTLRDNAGDPEAENNFQPMTIAGVVYDKRDEAGKALMEKINTYNDVAPLDIGSYRGFGITLNFNPHFAIYQLTLKGRDNYRVNLGDNAAGNITRINNALNDIQKDIDRSEQELDRLVGQVKLAQAELDKPFAQENELAEKSARLAQLNLELNINSHSGDLETDDDLVLDEDEEYDFRAELADTGVDEEELFKRSEDDIDAMIFSDTPETTADSSQDLSEQEKRGELIREIESGAQYDIEGTKVSESALDSGELEDISAAADLYGETTDLERYKDFRYPKAAQFLDIHGIGVNCLDNADDGTYRILLEGEINSIMREHDFADPAIGPYSLNPAHHFIWDCAMSIVYRELDVPFSPPPETLRAFSADEIRDLKDKGKQLAELALYDHLPQVEREKIINFDDAKEQAERRAVIAEAKGKLGGTPVITDAMEGRMYEGEIIEAGETIFIQKIEEGRGIIHSLSDLREFDLPSPIKSLDDPYVEIAYDREMNGSIRQSGHDRQTGRSAMSR